MKLHDAIASGITHILQNRLRAMLSVLGILIGTANVLCMIAIGDGAKQIIAEDIDKFGGANQVQFWTRFSIWRRSRILRYTTERYKFEDIKAIETECPDVMFVLPKNDRYYGTIINRQGSKVHLPVEGVTGDYARGLRWQVEQGRFFPKRYRYCSTSVCPRCGSCHRTIWREIRLRT